MRATDQAGNATTVTRHFAVRLPSGTPPTGQHQALSEVDAVLKHAWSVQGATTRIRKLRAGALPAGSRVAFRCQGKGCLVHKRTVRPNAHGVADLRRLLKRPLHAGAVVTLRITAPGRTGEVVRIMIRRGHHPKVTLTPAD